MKLKCIKNIKRKRFIKKFDRHMFNMTFGGTRKKGVTDSAIYRRALYSKKHNLYEDF